MTSNEIRDLELIERIQSLCDEAKEWDGPASFEAIWQSCSDEKRNMKFEIGERIIELHKLGK